MTDLLHALASDLADTVENVIVLDVTNSTHDLAKRLITDMDDEGQHLGPTVVVADRQRCGVGRAGRCWESPYGGLYLNWLRSDVNEEAILNLPIAAAAAAHVSLTEVGVDAAGIKWPNDILVDGRKLAGIVAFARRGESIWATVGFGVNIVQTPMLTDQTARAISLAEHLELDKVGDCRRIVASSFVTALDGFLDSPEASLERWRVHLLQQPGDAIRVRLADGRTVSGTLVEITDSGHLTVLQPGGVRLVVSSGDVLEA